MATRPADAATLPTQSVSELIEQLGDQDPTVRQAAQRELIKIGPAAAGALRMVATDKDPERAVRAQTVLKVLDFIADFGGMRSTAYATSPNGAYMVLVFRDTHLGLVRTDESRGWFRFDVAEERYPGLVKINDVRVADNGDIVFKGTARVKDQERAVSLLLNQDGDLLDVLLPQPAQLAGQNKPGPIETRVVEYVEKGGGNIDNVSERNFLDLDSGDYHKEFPSIFAREGGQGTEELKKAGVDLVVMRIQGGMRTLVQINLKLVPVADKAWEGEAGLIEEALERAVPQQSDALTKVGAARTWAFQTREGRIGVMRVAANQWHGAGYSASGGVTIQYRLLPSDAR